MAYVITNTRGQTIATILTGEDNTTATDLTLIGQNYIEFGLAQNENFVHILENFAAPTPPLHPIQGQLWYDTTNNQVKLRTITDAWTGLADTAYVQAQKVSPAFTGIPTAPTAAGGTQTNQIATTAFVLGEISTIDLTPFARLDGAVFTGNLAANTAPVGTVTTQVATTAFVRNLLDDTASSLYVVKVDGEMFGNARAPTLANIFENSNRIATTQWVQSLYGNVFVSPYAPKDSPLFTGVPQAPTAPVSTSNTQIATTGFVQTLYANVDLSPYAPKASPTFTGTPRSTTANASDNSTQIATTNFVQLQKVSPAFTGVPTAPTAPANTANTQIATTAFVAAATAGFITAASVDELAGSIKMWASITPPANWALCNGQAISRTAYATLFSRIGTTYGSGDGSTTFNLPDFRDRFPIGAGAAYNAGATGGFADAAVISHTHPASTSISINDPGHLHQVRNASNNADNNRPPGLWYWADRGIPPENQPNNEVSPATTGITATATTSISAPTGSVSGTGRNLPPYLGAYWIIKISDDGSGGGTLQAGSGIDITTAGLYSTITNTGVRSLTAGSGITLSGSTGNITISSTGGGGGDGSRAGDIKWVAYDSSNFPQGWQLCDGSALLRSAYPALFTRIGTTYGAGNGSTTFNIPDLRGRFIASETAGATGANRASITRGGVGGSADAVVVSHTHSITDPGHSHQYTTKGGNQQSPADQWNGIPGKLSDNIQTTANVTGISIQSSGESGTGKNLPPYVGMVAIIKLSDDAFNTGSIIQAGSGIAITTSGAYATISSTVSQNPVVAGPGITVQNSTGGALVSANVRNIVAGTGVSIDNNNGNYTINSTATSGSITAWAHMNNVNGIRTLLGSYNINSVSVGSNYYYTFNFVTPMQNSNYCVVATVYNTDGAVGMTGIGQVAVTSQSNSSFTVYSRIGSGLNVMVTGGV